jgi:hypothetical protein
MRDSDKFNRLEGTQETFDIEIIREDLQKGTITREQSLIIEPPEAPVIEFKIYDNDALSDAMGKIMFIFEKTRENLLVSRPSCLNPTNTTPKKSAYASVYRVLEVSGNLDNQQFRDYADWMLRVGIYRIAEIVRYCNNDIARLTSSETIQYAIRLRNLMPHELIFPAPIVTHNNMNELTIGIDFLLVIGMLHYNDGNKFISF